MSSMKPDCFYYCIQIVILQTSLVWMNSLGTVSVNQFPLFCKWLEIRALFLKLKNWKKTN